MITSDPIVDEMREAGKKLQENCNNDLHLFSKMINKETERHKKEGWKVVSKKDIESSNFIESTK